MPLNDEQRQAIRDEEFFRSEVRKELAGVKGPPSFMQSFTAFFETKAGFWLLTTVLAGVAATGYGSLQRYLDREAIAKREAVEQSRRDLDTVLKLGPMLTSDKRSQIDMAVVLLDDLANDNALDSRIAGQVKALVQSALSAGLRQDATREEQAQASAILTYADRARINAIQRPEAAAAAAVAADVSPKIMSSAIDSALLPARVYLQIAADEDRTRAEVAMAALRKAGIVVPGIEKVPLRSAPQVNDLRYCEAKVEPATLERVKAAVDAAVSPTPRLLPLTPRVCGNVRANHFEVWYARARP